MGYGTIMKMRRGKIVARATGVGVFAVVVLMGVYWRDLGEIRLPVREHRTE